MRHRDVVWAMKPEATQTVASGFCSLFIPRSLQLRRRESRPDAGQNWEIVRDTGSRWMVSARDRYRLMNCLISCFTRPSFCYSIVNLLLTQEGNAFQRNSKNFVCNLYIANIS